MDDTINLLENLTNRDLRIIARSEEELTQTRKFQRLLPDHNQER